ncbi:unnamed protein product [Symbiodinium sp. CCMP2456]|nr:unnamed protein product [Symbiodinium sp. CCMP2456]
MAGGDGVAGEYDGTLSFSLDGRVRSSSFVLHYGETGYSPITLQFDPFALTKLQKDVSRFVGGYLAKEWEAFCTQGDMNPESGQLGDIHGSTPCASTQGFEVNGPDRKKRYEKTSARALVADVHQQELSPTSLHERVHLCESWQENLNDCGVFVLENMLRSLSMKKDFLKQMSSATPQVSPLLFFIQLFQRLLVQMGPACAGFYSRETLNTAS